MTALPARTGAAASASIRRCSAAASLAWRLARALRRLQQGRLFGGLLLGCRGSAAPALRGGCRGGVEPGQQGIGLVPAGGAVGVEFERRCFGLRLCQQQVQLRVEAGDLGLGGLRLPGQFLFHGFKALGTEQALQQLQTVGRLGAQERREVPLRQHDHARELVPVHAQDVGDLGAGLIIPARFLHPRAVDAFAQQRVGLLDREAVPAPGARLVPRGRAGDFEVPALGREFAGDARLGGGLRVVAAQPLSVLAGPGNRSVEGEADGVQDAGLARAGGAVQQEQPVCAQAVEVDPLRAGKRAERGNLQAVDPHRDTPSRRTASSASARTAASASEAGLPRTCSRNPQQTERSSSASASRLL